MSETVVVSNGVSNFSCVYTPPASTAHRYELATLVDAAMVTGSGLGTFQCVYGFHQDPARTGNQFQYSVNDGSTNAVLACDIVGTPNTGAEFATILQTALNAKEALQSRPQVLFTVAWNAGTSQFDISYVSVSTPVVSMTIRSIFTGNYRKAGPHVAAGFQLGGDRVTVGSSGSISSDYTTAPSKFIVAFAGLAGKLKLSSGSFTSGAKSALGFPGETADITIQRALGTVAVYTEWTITSSAGSGGSIVPSGAVTVHDFDDQSFTMTPDGGYSISNVIVDGGSIGAVSAYTFTTVTSNHTISVMFLAPAPAPSFSPGGLPESSEPRTSGRSHRVIVPSKNFERDYAFLSAPRPLDVRIGGADPERITRARQRLAGRLDTGMQYDLDRRWPSLTAEQREALVTATHAAVLLWLTGQGAMPSAKPKSKFPHH